MGEPPNLSLWLTSTEDRAYPRLDGDVEADVTVVGAGIVGISCALELAAADRSVVLLEADGVCRGVTGYTTAKVTPAHGLIYSSLEEEHGSDIAGLYGRANLAALERIGELVDGLSIECSFERRLNYVYTEQPSRVGDIKDEVDAARRAGLDAEFVTKTPLPFPVAGAVRSSDGAQFHPRLYLFSLLEEFERLGGLVFDRSRVTGVSEGDPCEVKTATGVVSSEHVVIATNYPILDRGLFFPRVHPKRSYVVAGRVPEDRLVDGMFLNSEQPTRSVRTARAEGGSLLLVGGEGHTVGRERDTEERYRALERWAREHFGMEQVTHRWSTQDGHSVDQLPYVGRLHPASRKVLRPPPSRGGV